MGARDATGWGPLLTDGGGLVVVEGDEGVEVAHGVSFLELKGLPGKAGFSCNKKLFLYVFLVKNLCAFSFLSVILQPTIIPMWKGEWGPICASGQDSFRCDALISRYPNFFALIVVY